MLRSRSSMSLALPQFFESDDVGRAWKRAREKEQVRAYRHRHLSLNVVALVGLTRRVVAHVVSLRMQTR
jgi:hypothetical protein